MNSINILVPSSPNSCLPVPSDCPRHSYDPYKVYEYDYQVMTTTSMKGTSDQESKVKVTATALITMANGCQGTLEVGILDHIFKLLCKW